MTARPRLAGVFYLLTFLTGIPVLAVSARLMVPADAAATAANILAQQPLFRLGFAAYLVNLGCYLAVTLLFYELFKPVSSSASMFAALFSLVGTAVQAASCAFYAAPLVILGGAPYLKAFTPSQLQSLSLLFLKLHGQAYNIGLVFFGAYCVLIGRLAFRSGFLPRPVGMLMMIGGLGWLTFLVPPFAAAVAPYNLALGVLGEGSLTIWLLAKGIAAPRGLPIG